MKHRLMALLSFYLCLFVSVHAQGQGPNSNHPFYSNEDGRKFAITFAVSLVVVFVVLSIAAYLTERQQARELPRKEQPRTKEPSAAREKERTCQRCGAKLTKAPGGGWFCLNC
jgi:hypothetical protein